MKSRMMQRRPLLAAFFLPVSIMLFIVIARGIYPFGDRSFLRIDLYNQYFPFFTEYWRKLHEGGSFFYSRYLGLGGSFAGVFAYYLASPLHLILLLCPQKWIQECMVLLIIGKLGLCGLSFAWWLKERFRTDSYLISAFGLLYALSGYTAAYNWNIMWLDVICLAPVVIAGLERLIAISAGKRKNDIAGICLYPVALGLAIWCNYYLCIMLCIFLVLRFVIGTLDLTLRQKGAAFLRFAAGSLLGGALSAFVSLPGVLALRVTKFDDPNFSMEIKSYFNIIQAFARHFVLTECEIRNEHWPNVYCGVIILFLVPLWFVVSKRSRKVKVGIALLLAFFWASYTFNVLTFFWHGLNFPDSLPARQSYLYIFLLLTLAFEAIGEIRPDETTEAVTEAGTETEAVTEAEAGVPDAGSNARRRKACALIIAAALGALLILICCLFGRSEKVGNQAMIMTALYFACYVIVTASYFMKSYGRRLFVGLMLAAIFTETCMNTYRVSVPTTDRDGYVQAYETNRAIVSALRERTDETFYRIDERDWKTKNDGILASYPSATYFSSTASGGVENLYRKLGMASSKVFYHMEGAVPLTTALLGVRYLIDPDEYPAAGLFRPVLKADELGDHYADRTVYEAEDTLPIGYMIPTGLEEKWEEEIRINKAGGSNTPVANLNALVRALGFSEKLFRLRDGDEGGMLYAYVISSPTKDVKIYTDREERTFEKVNYKHILTFGRYEDGAKIDVHRYGTVLNEKKAFDYRIYILNEDLSHEVVRRLAEETFTVTETEDGYVKGTVSNKEAGDLLLTIPAEDGWTIFVDGEETDLQTFEDAFIRIPLETGTHEIELRFSAPGVWPGRILTLIGAFLLGIWVYFEKKHFKGQDTLLK